MDRHVVELGSGVRIRTPVQLARTAGGVDTKASSWEGPGITATIDDGPFSDPLTSFEQRPNARTAQEMVGGRAARVASARLDDGRHLAAAHFEQGITVSIVADGDRGEEVALEVLRSIEFM